MALFYEKWLNDLADAQDPETGAIPDTAPISSRRSSGFSIISSVLVLLPWFYYQFYGDLQPLRCHYEAMKKYVAFRPRSDRHGGDYRPFLGEWAPPITQALLMRGGMPLPNIPTPIITTGYLYYDYYTMEKAADVLGIQEDADRFAVEREQVKEAVELCVPQPGRGAAMPMNAQACNIFPAFPRYRALRSRRVGYW